MHAGKVNVGRGKGKHTTTAPTGKETGRRCVRAGNGAAEGGEKAAGGNTGAGDLRNRKEKEKTGRRIKYEMVVERRQCQHEINTLECSAKGGRRRRDTKAAECSEKSA